MILAALAALVLLLAGCAAHCATDDTLVLTALAKFPEKAVPVEEAALEEPVEEPRPELIVRWSVDDTGLLTLMWNDDGSGEYTVTRTARGETRTVAAVSGSETRMCTVALPDVNGEYFFTVTGDSEERAVEVPIKNGMIVEDAVLRCYKNGEPVKNADVNGLRFNENGIYTSGDKALDNAVTAILRQVTEQGMSRLEMFRAAYDWIVENYEYETIRFPDTEKDGWQIAYTKDLIATRKGNCFSYAAATAMFAKALGFDARTVYGSCNQTYEWCDHCWTEVTVNGTALLCDAEMEGVFSANRDFGWKLFMREFGTTPTQYIAY